MPYLTVYTNVEFNDGAAVAAEASALTAKILHKPESYVVASIIYNSAMCFGGNVKNKGALVELKSIGLGDKDRYVSELTKLLAERLNISDTHYIAIALTDAPATYTACGGQTFG